MAKRFLITLVFCVLFTSFFVPTTFAADTVKLQFCSWMVAEQSGGEVWLPQRIKEWEKSHPNVSVEVIPLAWEDTPNKITLQVQAGNAPDVFTIESLWLGKFATVPKAVEDLKIGRAHV
jgi:ABC-type glycerol-3-phosphate transport system substrate-binding protein